MLLTILLACSLTHKCTADHYKLKIERKDRVQAQALARASEKARKTEQEWSALFDLAATMNQEAIADVRTQKDRIIADLRAGRLSFRAACTVPQAPAHPGEPEGREEGGQSGLVAEAITERLAACDEVTHERNLAAELLLEERG